MNAWNRSSKEPGRWSSEKIEVIRNECPENASNLPPEIRVYFNFQDDRACAAGLVLKGEKCVIPQSLRWNILKSLHSSHLGVSGTIRCARVCVLARDVQPNQRLYPPEWSVCKVESEVTRAGAHAATWYGTTTMGQSGTWSFLNWTTQFPDNSLLLVKLLGGGCVKNLQAHYQLLSALKDVSQGMEFLTRGYQIMDHNLLLNSSKILPLSGCLSIPKRVCTIPDSTV